MRQKCLIIEEAGLSSDNPFRAIVQWDSALPSKFIVFPLGGTAERDDQIRTILERALTSLQANHAGIQDERRPA